MPQISRLALDVVRQRMEDGFNAAFASRASQSEYLVTGFIPAFTISWGRDGSGGQFFEAQITPEDLDDTTASKYPLVFLYPINSANLLQTKGGTHTFDGAVTLRMDWWLAWPGGTAMRRQFSTLATCLEDTLNAVLCDPGWIEACPIYNGKMTIDHGPVMRAGGDGEDWRQLISATITMVTRG